MNSTLSENNYSYQGNKDASSNYDGKNNYYQGDNLSQNGNAQSITSLAEQNQQALRQNQSINEFSPQKRSNSKPPLSGNKFSDNKSKIQSVVKMISTLANIKQRDEDSEDNTHNSNILNSQQQSQMAHHHSHNHLDMSRNETKQKNFQERMMRERIKAAEKSFVVGRLKADDSRLPGNSKRTKTEMSNDENGDNLEQEVESTRQKSSNNLRSTKGSNMTGNINVDRKEQRNNSHGISPAKALNRSTTQRVVSLNKPESQQSIKNLMQQPSQTSLKKKGTTTLGNQAAAGNPQTPSDTTDSYSQNQNQDNRNQVKLQTEGDQPNKDGSYFELPTHNDGQDREQAQNKILLKLNLNPQGSQQNKRVQLPSEGDQSNKSNGDTDSQRIRSNNILLNRADSSSKSPISSSQRRQVRSYSSKGFTSNRSSDRLSKNTNKSNLPRIHQRVHTQPENEDSNESNDSFSGKSKITEGTRKKRSSYSYVNMHEKKLIDQGLNLKKLNNMDLILSKITKTHNQRGDPYSDPLTQQIFTKQFTEVFVKKLEKKRKNQKQTGYDYVDAAKIYYSVCDGSKLSKPEIGRGQKYLLNVASQQNQQMKKDKSQNDMKKTMTNMPSQSSIHHINQSNQQFFNPSATFQPTQQSQQNLGQSESSPTIIHSQSRAFNNDNGDLTQQSFRTNKEGISPQTKFQPLFMGSRNTNQTPIYFNFVMGGNGVNGSDFASSIYPVTTSSTHSFYPHSHFHRLNPLSGISSIPSQRDKSPFNITQNMDTNYGQSHNYSQQDPMSPDRRGTNLDYQPSSIINNTNHYFNQSIDYPQSNIYNNNNNKDNNTTANNQSSSNILDKSRNPTQFTSSGKLILPKLALNQSSMDPDLQKAIQCSKILQYLNDSELPSNKKKKPQIDAAEREKARQRLLGSNEKANQPKSFRQIKEDERKRQDDEKFNGPVARRGKGENGSIEGSILQNPTTTDNSIISEQPKQVQMKKSIEEYHNFTVSYTQNYNETVSIVLKRGYPEDNEQSLLKVDQLSKDNFKNFQWKFDEVWFPLSTDQNSQRFRVLKGRDEKIKQKCSFHFFNCSDLSSHKDYLKEVSIAYLINLHYEKDRVRNPTLLMYSIPNIFQQNKKEVEFVSQHEYYSTLECILEYRYQIRQEWEEEEMISIFYSLLDCMNELYSLNICHGNITPAHIAYSYKTNRYKIFNFSSAQVGHRDYKVTIIHLLINHKNLNKICSNIKNQGGYPIYYQWPFIAPEVKKGLSYNNRSNKYDILASDMYSLGMSFLMIKYLIPENLRSQDAMNRLINTVESDNRLSAQIIKSLLNKQQTKRIDNTYAKLCNHIHSVMKSKKQEFDPYQKQDLVNLNPLHKQKWRQSKDSEVIADFYYRIFQWQNAADRLQKLIDELLQIEKEQGGDSNLSPTQKEKKQRILRDVWKSYFKQQEYDNALKYNQLYMELLSQTPEEKMKDREFLESLAEDLKMTGQLYFTVQQPEKAIGFFDKTIQVITDLHGANHQDVVAMLNNIGVLYKSLQNYPKALQYFQEAQQIMETTRSTEDDLYFFIKYNIGIIYFEQEELSLAENILYEIYKVKTTEHRVKSVEVSQYAYVLGNVYIKKNHLPKAQQVIEMAIKMRESCIGYDGELIKWKQLLANICFQLGQRKEAMDILVKTVTDVKKLRKQPQNPNPDSEDATYNAIEDIGNMILETGNKKEALKFYHEALQLAKNQQEKQTGIIGALEKKIKEVKK